MYETEHRVFSCLTMEITYSTQTFGNNDTQKRKIESRQELRGGEQASKPLALQLEGAVICAQQHNVIRLKSGARDAISARLASTFQSNFPVVMKHTKHAHSLNQSVILNVSVS